MYNFKLVLLILLLISTKVFSQTNYFEQNLKILSSNKMKGRGYKENGMKKASLYLEKEMKKHGLKKLNDSYLQPVKFPINIIEDAHLVLSGKKMVYGKDFIVKPNSGSAHYKKLNQYHFPIITFNESFKSLGENKVFTENELNKQNNKYIILPDFKSRIDSINKHYKNWGSNFESTHFNDQVIFRFTSDSLTSSLSQKQSYVSEFIIKSKYYKENLEINDYQLKVNFDPEFEFNNVIGYIDGFNNDSTIVITAHYDHLGKVGKTIFPGASDNASGTAMVLDLMKYYSAYKPQYRTVFMFFGAEEAGIVGAYHYVENPLFPLEKIKFLVNLDLMAAGDQGIQVVNGTKYLNEYNTIVNLNSESNFVKEVKIRGESCNSDHCPFDKKGVPSIFIYTLGGNGHYHSLYDTYDHLDLSYSKKVKDLIIRFINQL